MKKGIYRFSNAGSGKPAGTEQEQDTRRSRYPPGPVPIPRAINLHFSHCQSPQKTGNCFIFKTLPEKRKAALAELTHPPRPGGSGAPAARFSRGRNYSIAGGLQTQKQKQWTTRKSYLLETSFSLRPSFYHETDHHRESRGGRGVRDRGHSRL